MITRVKRQKHTSTEKIDSTETGRISVNVPVGLKDRFIKRLNAQGYNQRSQGPTIVKWIKEYVDGKRDVPPDTLSDVNPEELRLLARLLELMRNDPTTQDLVETWIATRKDRG
jgi:hypothetical protein